MAARAEGGVGSKRAVRLLPSRSQRWLPNSGPTVCDHVRGDGGRAGARRVALPSCIGVPPRLRRSQRSLTAHQTQAEKRNVPSAALCCAALRSGVAEAEVTSGQQTLA